jgi:hypothetical protein
MLLDHSNYKWTISVFSYTLLVPDCLFWSYSHWEGNQSEGKMADGEGRGDAEDRGPGREFLHNLFAYGYHFCISVLSALLRLA